MKFDKSKLPSRHVSVGVKSAPHRSMYYAMGLKNEDIEKPLSRVQLAQASVHGIYALMNSGDGPTNGFAYYFGVKDSIPHGLAGGMFLRDVMLWNHQNGYNKYQELLHHTATENMENFFKQFDDLLIKYSIPRLSNYGYKEFDCSDLSAEVSLALTGSFSGNPIPFDIDSAEWVLKQQFLNKD